MSHIPNGSERQSWSRRGVLAALAAALPATALTGCGGSADASEGTKSTGGGTGRGRGTAGSTSGAADAKTSEAKAPTLTVTPADGTKKAGGAA
ncbi:hypothetical protein ABZ612_21390 [Streptomyces avermitilis]|uniref:hypothetical protein n=1 Tax=Streptomyces avermitilis TaxID=33903 RepID=UPI0033DCD3B9